MKNSVLSVFCVVSVLGVVFVLLVVFIIMWNSVLLFMNDEVVNISIIDVM